MNDISQKFEVLEQKIQEAKEKVDQKKNQNIEKIDDTLKSAKGDLIATEESVRVWADETKESGFADMLEMKLSVKQKADEIKAAMAQRKYENEKHRKSASVEYSMEYAAYLIEIAMLTIDEATVATLEYIAEEMEYEKLYGAE